MFDFAFKLLEPAAKLLRWLWGVLKSPIGVEVTYFDYDEVRNAPGERLFVITPYPRSYYAILNLTNRTDKPVYIKSMSVLIGAKSYPHDGGEASRLDPQEFKQVAVSFPISSGDTPARAGQFEIAVTPAVGRKATASGKFPLDRSSGHF